MKARLFILAILSAFLLQSCEKDNTVTDVTDKTIANFNKMYPEAQGTEWKLREGYAIATFYLSSADATSSNNSAWFHNETGEWGMTETEIVYTELPEDVRTAFEASEYAGWTVEDIDLLSREGIENTYVIEVEKAEMELDLYYNESGILMKAEQDAEDEDGDNDYIDQMPGEYMDEIERFVSDIYNNARIIDIEEEDVEDGDKGEREIVVEILDGSIEREIHFDMEGVWQYTETEMEPENLPAIIRNVIVEKYPEAEIDDVTMIENSTMIFFEIELETGNNQEVTVFIREDGTILP